MFAGDLAPTSWLGRLLADARANAAAYVDRILRGAKVSDLPVQQPTQFEFVINLKVAKTLGFTISAPLRLRATQLIE